MKVRLQSHNNLHLNTCNKLLAGCLSSALVVCLAGVSCLELVTSCLVLVACCLVLVLALFLTTKLRGNVEGETLELEELDTGLFYGRGNYWFGHILFDQIIFNNVPQDPQRWPED